MSKPVICQFVHTLNVGGAELLARQFAEVARERYDFEFVCLDTAGDMARELSAYGYRVEVIGRRPGFDLACVWRLTQVLRGRRVELVHAHQYAPFFYATLSRCMSLRPIHPQDHSPVREFQRRNDSPNCRRSDRRDRRAALDLLLRGRFFGLARA